MVHWDLITYYYQNIGVVPHSWHVLQEAERDINITQNGKTRYRIPYIYSSLQEITQSYDQIKSLFNTCRAAGRINIRSRQEIRWSNDQVKSLFNTFRAAGKRNIMSRNVKWQCSLVVWPHEGVYCNGNVGIYPLCTPIECHTAIDRNV